MWKLVFFKKISLQNSYLESILKKSISNQQITFKLFTQLCTNVFVLVPPPCLPELLNFVFQHCVREREMPSAKT
jgi:hypothetical protein